MDSINSDLFVEEGEVEWNESSLDAFIENYIASIEQSLEKEVSDDGIEEELITFEYLGIKRGCEKKQESINNGCMPLEDRFYEIIDELREVEIKLVLNRKKMEYLFSEIKKLEEENSHHFPVQQSLIDEIHDMFEYQVEEPE